MKKRPYYNFIKNKYTIIGLIVLVILIGYYFTHRSSSVSFESAPVVIGDVIEKVSVTGSISPLNKADLAFKKSGVISRILVKVGDKVKKGDVIAALDDSGDLAAYASAKSTLDDYSRNLSKEELAVQKTSLDNAKQNASNAVNSGYAKVQSALVNYIDGFFNNPKSVNPTLTLTTDSTNQTNKINNERLLVTETLDTWLNKMALVKPDTITPFIVEVDTYLASIKVFFNDLSGVVENLNSGSSGLTQSTIDTYNASMNTGLTTLNSAIDTISSAKTALLLAQSNYDLKLAGNSSASIAAQQAKVAQALVNVNDARIVAPIDGIISKADPNVGEFVAAGQSGFSVQNIDGYKIEAYVPEADIAKITIGNKANITLDSYGQYVNFGANVISIDPAETILEGVPTYKVSLQFDSPDNRIRSGMTANTDIFTRQVSNVLTVSTRAIIDDNGQKSIRVINSDKKTFSTIPIKTGLKGSDGTSEIISGIKVGDKVVTYIK